MSVFLVLVRIEYLSRLAQKKCVRQKQLDKVKVQITIFMDKITPAMFLVMQPT